MATETPQPINQPDPPSFTLNNNDSPDDVRRKLKMQDLWDTSAAEQNGIFASAAAVQANRFVI
jgi:hypothetical protein